MADEEPVVGRVDLETRSHADGLGRRPVEVVPDPDPGFYLGKADGLLGEEHLLKQRPISVGRSQKHDVPGADLLSQGVDQASR